MPEETTDTRPTAQPTTLKTARNAVAWSFTLAALDVDGAERAAANIENLVRAILAEGST